MLENLPGVGMINLAQLLAEVGPILDRVDSAEQAATECGAAPVTRASGKTSGVYFRWAANTRARKAITSFAHNARMQDDWAAAALRRRPGTRKTQPARHPHRRPRLAPRHLGLLDQRTALRSQPSPHFHVLIPARFLRHQPTLPARRRGQDGAPHG